MLLLEPLRSEATQLLRKRFFAVVPSLNMQIGNRILTQITFVTPVRVAKNLPQQHADGLFPTVLFQRVFISSGEHYVVFDPNWRG